MEATLEWEEPKHNNPSPKILIFCTAAENATQLLSVVYMDILVKILVLVLKPPRIHFMLASL